MTDTHKFIPGHIDGARHLFVACAECGKPYLCAEHVDKSVLEFHKIASIETRDILTDLNNELWLHDCHASPEDGCATCEEIRKEAERRLEGIKSKIE